MKVYSASRRGFALLCGALIMFASGCGPKGGAGVSIDESSARDSLTKFLDTWKSGGTVESLKSQDINGNDFDWNAGATLVSYTIVKDLKNDGANLDVQVELNLKDKDGAESTVQAVYQVTTEPAITVIRSDEELSE